MDGGKGREGERWISDKIRRFDKSIDGWIDGSIDRCSKHI